MKKKYSTIKSSLSTSFNLSSASERTIASAESYFSSTISPLVDNNLSQEYLSNNIPLLVKEKLISLDLPSGHSTFTQCGRFNLLYSSTGHIASTDYKTHQLLFERELEPIKQAIYLHSEELIAIIHPKLCIYNKEGVELHTINLYANTMQYLPYHYLLAVANKKLTYIDITVGKKVSIIDCKVGNILKENKGIIYSVNNQKIELFSPNTKTALVKILAHKNNISTLEVNDNYIYSTGLNILNTHDIRNTYKPLSTIKTKYSYDRSALSENGILALGHRNKIQCFYQKDNNIDLYLHDRTKSNINTLCFIPHEDILSIGHNTGISSFIIPGSGNPNFSEYDNPFMHNRKEIKVKKLLEKIPMEMIGLESTFKIEEEKKDKEIKSKKVKAKRTLDKIFNE